MSATSPEWQLEDYCIRACQFAGTLPPEMQLRHHDDAGAANDERLVFTATTGAEEPPGAGVYETELEIDFRSTNRDAASTDNIFASVLAAFGGNALVAPPPGALEYAQQLFPAGLWYEKETSEDARNNSRDSIQRTRTFLFYVGQTGGSPAPDYIVIVDSDGTIVMDTAGTIPVSL